MVEREHKVLVCALFLEWNLLFWGIKESLIATENIHWFGIMPWAWVTQVTEIKLLDYKSYKQVVERKCRLQVLK
jgi:hypothetical protein